MGSLAVILALLPVIIIFLLLTLRRTPADIAGAAGWVVAIVVAWWYFQTPLSVLLRASTAGILASLPIAIVVGTSLYQMTVMMETGAIRRLVALIKTVAREDQVTQILIINIGFGTLLTALGAVPVSILPPIMLALGYSSFVAIALPAIGYDALCTYALLGVPVVMFAKFVDLSVDEVGYIFARFMPIISTCIAFGMLWIVGRWKLMAKGFVPTLLAGATAGFVAIGMNAIHLVTLTGIAAGISVIIVMLLYMLVRGKKIIDRGALQPDDLAAEKHMSLARALSPWIILTAACLLVNAPFLPFLDLFFKRLAMPVELIPGKPEQIRLFWQAYFWILVSTVLAFPFLRPTRAQLSVSWKKWLKRAPRPIFAAAIFFAIAYVLNHSGKAADWTLVNPMNNMVYVVAAAAAGTFGSMYPLVAPFLGLLGGFISGSETSAIAMLTKFHMTTAGKIGAWPLLIAAASGIGGGLASVISPAKLQNAASSIDRIGEESQVIRTMFVISIVITAVCAVLALIWS